MKRFTFARRSIIKGTALLLMTVLLIMIPSNWIFVMATQDELMKTPQPNPYQIQSKSFYRDEKSNDGTILLKCSLNYPKILPQENQGNFDSIQRVNREIETQAIKVFSKKCKDATDYTNEFLGQIHQGMLAQAWLPFVIDISYDMTFNQKDLLSFYYTEFEWLGGAHPSTELRGAIYDLKQGKALRPEDLLVLDEVGIKKFIADEMMKRYEKDPNAYFEEEIKALHNYDFEYGSYLNEEGFVFFFQPYSIAPYVAGVVSVYLRYHDYPELFRVDEPFQR